MSEYIHKSHNVTVLTYHVVLWRGIEKQSLMTGLAKY
uniref:Transposase n=1 Tax=Burkholderia gladioli TaxID=28095 RepID=A0A2Z4XG46_BURGA|nr:transposase [Burkholderia gladioli]